MSINTLDTAKLFQRKLDEAAVQDMVTGWMDGNAGQVNYTGGAEVKIPKISTQGLGNYDRDEGYPMGSVTLEYETRTMTQDRARRFQLDAMDVDESNFVLTALGVMAQTQREYITPEIDAYRLSKIAAEAVELDELVEYGYTPESSTIMKKIKGGIALIREKGYNGELICHLNYASLTEIELKALNQLSSQTFSRGGFDTTVPAVDDVPLIATPQNRLYTAIKINDGKTESQEAGGYEKGESAKDINFIIMAKTAPMAVTKQDITRIFSPEIYQKANAWAIDYRRYHDLWIPDNKKRLVYVNIKDSKS